MEESRVDDIQIVPMLPSHVGQVVSLHVRSFPGFFLSCLGPRFLRLLYSEILAEPDHVALIAQRRRGGLVGFVAGVGRQEGFYSRLAKRRWFHFALASLVPALRRPWIVARLYRALRQPKLAAIATSPALLMSLAVSDDARGSGVGAQLVHDYLNELMSRNTTSVSLTTDRDNNDGVNRFYQKLGFQLARQFVTPEGRWMNEYSYDLTAAPRIEASTVNPSYGELRTARKAA